MRDVAIRRGVVQVVDDFRRAARLDERGFERVFASGGGPPAVIGRDREGRLMVPAITLHALVPGIRSQVDGRPRPPDRVPRRELRGARLRLTAPGAPRPAERASPAVSLAGSGSPIRSRRSSTASSSAAIAALAGGRRCRRRVRLGLAMTALQVSIGIAQRPRRRAAGRRPQARQADPGRPGLAPAGARRGRRSPRRSGSSSRRPSGAAVVGLARVVLAIGLRLRPPPQGDRLVVAAVRGRDPAPARLRLARGGRVAARGVRGLLVAAAVLAGAALAIANALADVERDRGRGRRVGGDRAGQRARVVARARPGRGVLAVARRRPVLDARGRRIARPARRRDRRRRRRRPASSARRWASG